MLGRVAVRAEGDDLALLGEAGRQAGAGDDAQVRAGAERHDVIGTRPAPRRGRRAG